MVSRIFRRWPGWVLLMVLLTIGRVGYAEEQRAQGRKSARIVGGVEAEIGKWPWMAALVESDEEDLSQGNFCGGALIHPRWVVTASHCVSSNAPEDIDVVLGAHDLSASEEEGRVRVPVKRIICHPDYDNVVFDSDIALLELDDPVEGRALLDIFSGDGDLVGTTGTVMGWGRTSDGGAYSKVLMQVDLTIVSFETCKTAYKDHAGYTDADFTQNMRCAGDDGKDACQGDSGGPMIVKDGLDKWELAGIVSWGEKCADPNLYGVYTRPENFLAWIHEYVPIRGDWDQNGKLEMVDALGMVRGTAGLAEYRSAGDYNNNQKADLADVMAILAILAGI